MKVKIFLFLLGLCFSSFTLRASEFKLNQAQLDIKFSQSLEIIPSTFALEENVDQLYFQNKNINQNVVGLLAICCGTFGLHRFYMGHHTAGLIHLGGTFVTILVGIIAFKYADNYALSNNNIFYWLFYSAVGTIGYAIIWGVKVTYNVVEGLIYLTNSEDRFHEKLANDPRYFAAFSKK